MPNIFVDEPKVTKELKVSQDELDRRRKAVRDAMKTKGLDVLLVIIPGCIRWLTNMVPSAGTVLVIYYRQKILCRI